MHNHEKDGKGMGSMMWMMVICCAIPLVLILLFGLGGKAVGFSTWVIFGGVAVMMLAHFFIMGKSHKHSDEKQGLNDEDKNKDNKNNSGHGCCH